MRRSPKTKSGQPIVRLSCSSFMCAPARVHIHTHTYFKTGTSMIHERARNLETTVAHEQYQDLERTIAISHIEQISLSTCR
jgi:hypothetical protein